MPRVKKRMSYDNAFKLHVVVRAALQRPAHQADFRALPWDRALPVWTARAARTRRLRSRPRAACSQRREEQRRAKHSGSARCVTHCSFLVAASLFSVRTAERVTSLRSRLSSRFAAISACSVSRSFVDDSQTERKIITTATNNTRAHHHARVSKPLYHSADMRRRQNELPPGPRHLTRPRSRLCLQ